jgi:hypothetical protein
LRIDRGSVAAKARRILNRLRPNESHARYKTGLFSPYTESPNFDGL